MSSHDSTYHYQGFSRLIVFVLIRFNDALGWSTLLRRTALNSSAYLLSASSRLAAASFSLVWRWASTSDKLSFNRLSYASFTALARFSCSTTCESRKSAASSDLAYFARSSLSESAVSVWCSCCSWTYSLGYRQAHTYST